MKKIVKKTMLYCLFGLVLLVALSALVYGIRSDKSYLFYEDESIIQKADFYHKNADQYNCLVIGSSRLYRQVNPLQLDEELASHQLSTYNASVANLRPFRSLDYLDYLNLSDSVRYVVLELMPPTRIGDNYKANPELHSVDFSKFGVLLSMCLKSNYRKDVKAYYILRYSQTMAYKYLGFGLRKYISVLMGTEEVKTKEAFYDIKAANGFLPFEDELSIHSNPELDRRHNYFISDSVRIIEESIKSSLYDQRASISPQKDGFVTYLNQKTAELNAKGIDLYFVISPRKRPWDMRYLASIVPLLGAPVIDLSPADRYPEFYNYQYSFDDTHLNKKGAELFTSELAKQMNSQISLSKNQSKKAIALSK